MSLQRHDNVVSFHSHMSFSILTSDRESATLFFTSVKGYATPAFSILTSDRESATGAVRYNMIGLHALSVS